MSNKYHYLSPASATLLKFGLVKMYGFPSNTLQLSLLGITSSKCFPWASVITCACTQGKCLLGSAPASLTPMCSLNRYCLWRMAFVSNCASCMGICSFSCILDVALPLKIRWFDSCPCFQIVMCSSLGGLPSVLVYQPYIHCDTRLKTYLVHCGLPDPMEIIIHFVWLFLSSIYVIYSFLYGLLEVILEQ